MLFMIKVINFDIFSYFIVFTDITKHCDASVYI